MEPCDNMSPNQVNYVHMAHPNTTKYKTPWSYPLSTPVEGVDDTVDFWSTVGVSTEPGASGCRNLTKTWVVP